MRQFSKPLAFALVIALAVPVCAQLAPKYGFSANSSQLTSNPPGIRLDGNALIRIPELEVRANAIAFDGSKLENFTEVRGRGNVNLRITQKPKDGKGEAIQIQSKSDEATLTRATRTLVLKGNLSGFYRVGDGPQTMLSGNKATFNFAGQGLNALIESESNKQVELLLPAETNKPDALGPITVRADALRIDQANNAAYFSGNARAFSSSGANKLDVTAPSFTLVSAAGGAIGTLTTNGKTLTKLNVAPDPNAKAGATALSYVEVMADKATVNRATSTGVFDGNVKGFYRLQNSPEKFDISGERVTVVYDAEAAKTGDGLSVNVTGTPVDVEVPAFDLGF